MYTILAFILTVLAVIGIYIDRGNLDAEKGRGQIGLWSMIWLVFIYPFIYFLYPQFIPSWLYELGVLPVIGLIGWGLFYLLEAKKDD